MKNRYQVYEPSGPIDIKPIGTVNADNYDEASSLAESEYNPEVLVELDLDEYYGGEYETGVYYDTRRDQYVTFSQDERGGDVTVKHAITGDTLATREWHHWLRESLKADYKGVSDKALTDPAGYYRDIYTENGDNTIAQCDHTDLRWAKQNITITTNDDYPY